MAVAMSMGDSTISTATAKRMSKIRFHIGRWKVLNILRCDLAEFLQFVLLAQPEEFRHLLEALFAGHRGKGVVDTCLQIELAVFLLQPFGDEDDVDTGGSACAGK